MLMTPLTAFAPYNADPGPRITSIRPMSSSGSDRSPQVSRYHIQRAKIAPVLQDQHPAVQLLIESAGVDVEVIDAALHDVEPRHAGHGEGDLAGDRPGVASGRPHHVHRSRSVNHAVRGARDAFHDDVAQQDGPGLEHRVGRGRLLRHHGDGDSRGA